MRYRLRCTQGDRRGREIDLLLLEQALGPSALLSVQPGRLTIAPYQLVPVMRASSMTRARLPLADGVDPGRTIEAGMVIAELIARRRAHRALIVSPAGPLLQQWRGEMRIRVGLRFEAIRDWGSLQRSVAGSSLGRTPSIKPRCACFRLTSPSEPPST